ncbi:MAG: GGDEF domain-containing protein [Elusimicrobiota bacterium]
MTDNKNSEKEIEIEKLKDRVLTVGLIEILAGDREGTSAQKKKLASLKKNLKDKFYKEVIFFLTHIEMKNEKKARKFFKDIVKHKKSMEKKLDRHFSIEVAALDYLKDIKNVINRPAIIEEDKIEALTDFALKDGFTKLYDKKILFHDLKQEIEKAKRYDSVFSVAMLDLDNLKVINDTYGHKAGDKAIQKIAEVLKKNIRKADSSYRYGGDEFVILFPKLQKEQASSAVEKIMSKIRNEKLKSESGNFKLTVSIGLTAFKKDVRSAKDIIKQVDDLLYKAKQDGKNNFKIK